MKIKSIPDHSIICDIPFNISTFYHMRYILISESPDVYSFKFLPYQEFLLTPESWDVGVAFIDTII